jgi:hypothetical protein
VLNKRHGIIAVYMNLMCVVGRVYCCYYWPLAMVGEGLKSIQKPRYLWLMVKWWQHFLIKEWDNVVLDKIHGILAVHINLACVVGWVNCCCY